MRYFFCVNVKLLWLLCCTANHAILHSILVFSPPQPRLDPSQLNSSHHIASYRSASHRVLSQLRSNYVIYCMSVCCISCAVSVSVHAHTHTRTETGYMRARALIASNWIAIDRELAYFSLAFFATPPPLPPTMSPTFDEDLRSCFDLCQQRERWGRREQWKGNRNPPRAIAFALAFIESIIKLWRQRIIIKVLRMTSTKRMWKNFQLICIYGFINVHLKRDNANSKLKWKVSISFYNLLTEFQANTHQLQTLCVCCCCNCYSI